MAIVKAFRSRYTRPAGILVVAVCVLTACGQRTPTDLAISLSRLAEAIGPRRLVEPRLSAFDAYAPCSTSEAEGRGIVRAQCPGSPEPGSREFDAVFDFGLDIERHLATRGQPNVRHVQGLFNLVWIDTPGAVDDAIRAFEEAATDSPDDAELLSDLAACYIVRAQQQDDPLDLLHGLDLVLRSLELIPDLPEARFNKALALEKLYLRDLARRAWESYLEIDVASGWADEARDYLDRPMPTPVGEQWEINRQALVAAVELGDGGKVRGIVDRYRKDARLWAEDEVLAQWARAWDAGELEEAGRHLAVARAVGSALADLGGENLLHDAVVAIDGTSSEPVRRQQLARGHLAFAGALELIRERSFKAARSDLRRAAEALQESAFRWRARFFDQLCAGRSGNREEAVRLGQEIVAAVSPSGRYPVLLGRALWVMGTSLVVLGRFGASDDAYLRALALFEDAGEIDSFVAASNLVAANHREFGDSLQAWRLKVKTLRLLRDHPLPHRQRALLTVAAFSAAELNEVRTAHLFADAGLAMARKHLNDGLAKADAVATHLWHRAFFSRLLGRTTAALEDTAEAKAFCNRVESEDDRRTLLPEILLEEARSLVALRPADALESFYEAESMFQASETANMLPTLLRETARIYAALDEYERAEAALDGAIEILDGQRQELHQPWHQMSYFDRTGAVYDEKLALQLRQAVPPEELLRTVEDGRSRVLLDWLFRSGSASESVLRAVAHRPAPIEVLLERLRADTVVVEYEVLDRHLLTWIIHDGKVVLVSQEVDSKVLAAEVDSFRESLQHHGSRGSDSAILWKLLFEPIHSDIGAAESLLIVADDVLHNLPFSALRNSETGNFLIEDLGMSFAPSLQTLVELEEPLSGLRPNLDFTSATFLVAANPAFDSEIFDLEPLDGAFLEARAIEESFGDVEMLFQGREASPSAVLGGLESAEVFHYAGHALTNWRSPLRSSLVLAPEADGLGGGRLFARDFLGLDLSRLRLVVLSACDTAYGGRPSREGVVGLVWPFLAGGVPEVVASLWKVSDLATAQLFVDFYRELSAGDDPGAALRKAQLTRIAEGESFDWAAFQLFGLGVQ